MILPRPGTAARAVEQDVAPDPADVGLLRTTAQVSGAAEVSDAVEQIVALVGQNPVVLFMKGTPEAAYGPRPGVDVPYSPFLVDIMHVQGCRMGL